MKRTVGILVRISDDREDERKGVGRQEADGRELADRLNCQVGRVYVENDTSAFKRRTITLPNGKKAMRVIRPEFRQALDDLEAGRIEGLIAYDLDRVVRDPRDLEDLIDVVEMTTPRPLVRSVTGSLQLDTDADITNARVLVAMANKSSRDTARRVARAARERAEKGEYHGSKPAFGFEAVREIIKGRERVVDLEPHPEHAAWVNEAIERLLAGESLYGICTEWNKKGRRTGWKRRKDPSEENNVWYPFTLKRVVTNASIAGYREFEGELIEATWEPIVDRDDWERVRTLLFATDRGGRAHKFSTNARKYELSGLVFCAGTRHDECDHPKTRKFLATCPGGEVCGRVMVSMTANRGRANGKRIYRHSFTCNELSTGGCGSMRIEMHHLERYIEEMVFTRADSPALRTAVATKAEDIGEEEKQLRQAIRKDEEALQALEDEKDDGELPEASYRRRRKRLAERLEANEAALARATKSRARTRLPSGSVLRAQWPEKDNIWKRTILSSVIERIEISRHPDGMATNLTPRKGESDQGFARRLDMHRAEVLKERVKVIWWH